MIDAGIIGATGYAGAELTRLLAAHPQVTLRALSSESFRGREMAEVYSNLKDIVDITLCDPEQVVKESDCVFASLPHGLSQATARECFDMGKVFIDLGADFRLTSAEDYEKWYGKEYVDAPLHEKSVYGLCEINRERIKDCRVIGNPGCYPTSVALGLAPALRNKLIDARHVIIDSKSGVTGAGRGLTLGSHFPEANEAFSAYKIAAHRHTPEIEQELSELYGQRVTVTFVPHLLPVNRGILSTIYAPAKEGVTQESVRQTYEDFYRDERFVRVCDSVDLKRVKYSNYCDVAVTLDKRTSTLIVTSVIDNMVKGAAGQAIQNMNIIYGFKEDCGLGMIPPAF